MGIPVHGFVAEVIQAKGSFDCQATLKQDVTFFQGTAATSYRNDSLIMIRSLIKRRTVQSCITLPMQN